MSIIAIVVTVWAAWRSTNPKRRLYFYLDSVVPLVTEHQSFRDEITIQHQGKILTNPHLVVVTLISRGRRDIPSSSFDSDQPVVADLGAPIVRLLHTSSEATSAGVPAVPADIEETRLRIGPSLIHRRHTLTYTLLVDGEPHLTRKVPLLDVQLRDTAPTLPPARDLVIVGVIAAMATILAVATAIAFPEISSLF